MGAHPTHNVSHDGVVDVVRGRRRSVWNADARRIFFDVVGIRRRTRTLIARDRAPPVAPPAPRPPRPRRAPAPAQLTDEDPPGPTRSRLL